VSDPTYTVVKLAPGYDLGAFDCGEPTYNDWLTRHAAASVRAGVCAVYLLLQHSDAQSDETGDEVRVVGYYAINPTQVIRDDVATSLARGWPQTVPAWKLGKLAVHVDLRADNGAQWGRQLLRDALETIVGVADAGGGKVIVVDADNPGLLGFYTRNGFKPTGVEGDLSLYMKISTARKTLAK
jgi:ribosomal protein S18 acetylase RimI-like enzyme